MKQLLIQMMILPFLVSTDVKKYDSQSVNAADIVEMVNTIMGRPSEKLSEALYDLNGGGILNVVDIVARINIMNSKLKFIKISQWNVGHFNYGLTPAGIDTNQDNWEELANKTKDVLIDICSDIFIINENNTYWDRQKQHNIYDEWYKQFYPYYYHANIDNGEAIASVFPIKSVNRKLLPSGVRYYYEYVLNIFGEDVFVVNVHFSPYSSADREKDASGLALRYSGNFKVIISGDFNTGNNGESDETIISGQIKPFVDKGFTPVNWGMRGKLITHQTGRSLDNTYVKGFDIVYAASGTEKASSDHLPTKIELTTIVP